MKRRDCKYNKANRRECFPAIRFGLNCDYLIIG